MQFPQHKCGLYLSHNEHKDVYETVEDFYEPVQFPEGEWEKAVAADNVWSLHWYPDTPVGFYRVCASSLDAIQDAIKDFL